MVYNSHFNVSHLSRNSETYKPSKLLGSAESAADQVSKATPITNFKGGWNEALLRCEILVVRLVNSEEHPLKFSPLRPQRGISLVSSYLFHSFQEAVYQEWVDVNTKNQKECEQRLIASLQSKGYEVVSLKEA